MDRTYSIKDFLEVKSAVRPSFSPDGSMLAYLSNATGTHQLYLAPTEGGEAEQLTDYEDAVTFAEFSPTEEKILFGKHEGGNEQTQFYLLDVRTREVVSLTDRPDVRHDFGNWSYDGTQICFASTERNGTDFDAYVMDIATREKRCIFMGGGWCKATGFSPKGTYVTVRQDHSNFNADLYLCTVATGTSEHLTPHEGNVYYGVPQWLADESAFFLTQDADREYMGLGTFSLADKRFRYRLTPEWDIDSVAIDREGTLLSVIVNEDGYSRARLFDAHTFERTPQPLPEGSVHRTAFSSDGSRLALVVGDSRTTMDVWIADLRARTLRKCTESAQGVPAEVLVEPELIRYESFDGLSIPAFIYRPQRTPTDAKLPVIINIHGGPEAQYQPVLAPLTQYFVHRGFAVVAPNVRGSSGYGKTYLALDDVEKRMDSVQDIVALRSYLATVPDMDMDKIVLMGGSYGGFMVLAGLAFHPELWAAGVDTVGIVNFVTFLENTASYRRALREAEYGSLANDRDLLERISPINSIEKITAPLFVIHGANDPRVPLSEAEQVVSRLRALDRRVELLVYADEGHGLAKLQNRLDAYPKVAAFLEEVLRLA